MSNKCYYKTNSHFQIIMTFDYQKARELMVENQLRPNKIKDQNVLEIFKKIPKEVFIPEYINDITYSDVDIKLLPERGYLKNLHIAQLINNSDININHKILHIGALTGYVTTLLSKLCKQVVAIETDEKMNNILHNNIKEMELNNIMIVDGTFLKGFEPESPFDRIIIDTPINNLNKEIIEQVNDDYGKIIMIEKNKDNLSKAIKITKNKENFSYEYLFDVFSKYELCKNVGGFIF